MTDRASLRLGLLRLTDSAPVITAYEKGYFAANEVDVRLSVEPSWANIADKLTFGRLDGAVILPPLALALAMGLRGKPVALTVPMGISVNGNTVTLRREIADELGATCDALETGRRFASWIRANGRKARLAVVHVFSTHNLLLRYWLAAVGIDPERDVEIDIIPPSETADALCKGLIDGFCAGAPWGVVAEASGAGRTVVDSAQIWRNHSEKCLAMRQGDDTSLMSRTATAILDGARYCSDPDNAREIAAMLAKSPYLDLDPRYIAASLAARPAGLRGCPDFLPDVASVPDRRHALWFLSQMRRWGYASNEIDASTVADQVYRPAPPLSPAARERAAETFCDLRP